MVDWVGKLEVWVLEELGRIELLEMARLEVEEAFEVVDDLEVDLEADLEVDLEVEEDLEADLEDDLEEDIEFEVDLDLETVEDVDRLATHAEDILVDKEEDMDDESDE